VSGILSEEIINEIKSDKLSLGFSRVKFHKNSPKDNYFIHG